MDRMTGMVTLDEFISVTSYTHPVDIKKLRFIFSVFEQFSAKEGKSFDRLRVLEIGCGVGGITLPVAALGCRVRAIDIDEEDVAQLRGRLKRHQLDNVEVAIEDAFTAGGETYDVVIASEVFEHVLEPDRLAKTIQAQMRPGSYLIMTTPNGYGPFEFKNALTPGNVVRRWNWLRRMMGKERYVPGAGRDHAQRFTKGRLLAIFERASLRPVRFAKSDSFLTTFYALRRNRVMGNIDTRLADVLPHWMASGWYMVFELEE